MAEKAVSEEDFRIHDTGRFTNWLDKHLSDLV